MYDCVLRTGRNTASNFPQLKRKYQVQVLGEIASTCVPVLVQVPDPRDPEPRTQRLSLCSEREARERVENRERVEVVRSAAYWYLHT